ncbi:Cytosolic seryl-tRNA synthetase [Linnemannia hyalina]|uniref:Serine--tRNA ligase, cytoplasmic n=1 Tax=Linnemannia hyalina TaxID=64524 RepID=A0A9P7XT91_9FUNG|nr:Cytosolic seryl-tRNA synthetase [Linnemannia hyalina]
MLDINLFLEERGGEPELIRESQRRRHDPVEIVDEIIALYEDWKTTRFGLDQLNKKSNAIQKEIGMKMKKKEDASELIQARADCKKEQDALELDVKAKEALWNAKLGTVGNLVHDSVPISDNEDNNVVERTFFRDGKEPEHTPKLYSHDELLYRLGGYDPERGNKVASHRGYFLVNAGVELNMALVNYGLSFLGKRNYTKLQTPYFMKKEAMAQTAQLSQFDEELYKVNGENEDMYLIATSEQPISAFHANEWFEQPKEQLPVKYAGYSTCFRKEAGAHGRDTWGIFRVHQFEKIEQFCLTEPEKSWEMFDHMIENSEDFYKSLGLSYRVVSIVSGALNNAAAKKYDLEAWFPFQGAYKELVSCSNCTDYQSRNLEIRCGIKKMGDREKKYVHCLNSTLTATTRTLSCILENYQTPDGVRVPEVLIPYMDGKDFLPFVRELKQPKLGAVGNGKSSTLNSIIQEPLFQSGRSVTAVTKQIGSCVRPWRLPDVRRMVHIVDTPGMCESTYKDVENVHLMVEFFKRLSHGVSAFILVFNIHNTRLDEYSKNMLRLFERLLGPQFWKHVVIVFTHVDEDQRDYLEDNMEALSDPVDGFVSVLNQWFKLPYQPPVVFLSNSNTRSSMYARDCFLELYEAVVSVEEGAQRAKFTCTFFQEMNNKMGVAQDNFIVQSIRTAAVSVPQMIQSGTKNVIGACSIM